MLFLYFSTRCTTVIKKLRKSLKEKFSLSLSLYAVIALIRQVYTRCCKCVQQRSSLIVIVLYAKNMYHKRKKTSRMFISGTKCGFFFFFSCRNVFSFYFFPNLFYLLKLFSVPFTNSLVIYSFKFILSVFECFFLFSFFFYLPHFTPSSLCFVRRLAIMSICLYVSTVHWICQKKPWYFHPSEKKF